VTDNLTGLIWLRNADCFGPQDWTTALSDSNTLHSGSCGLTDGSAAGDWRLPNIRELRSLIDWQHLNPALPSGHPFLGVQLTDYWSSTSRIDFPIYAWAQNLGFTVVENNFKNSPFGVWPVRGGP
jgi:hypothetical protein